MKELQDVLDTIYVDSSNHISEGDFADDVAEKMPGWAIETWDMDDYNAELTSSVVVFILSEIKEGRTEIQYGEWCTDNQDTYYAVVASRKNSNM